MGKFTHISRAQLTEALYGSKAYLPKEFFQTDGQFSIFTDVFSFGMVIYEVCVGGKALDNDRRPQPYLRDLISDMLETNIESVTALIDPRMPSWPMELWTKLFELGKLCTEKRKKKRPKMEEVLVSLERLVVQVQVFIQTARRTDVNRNEVSPPPGVRPGASLESTVSSANSDVSSQPASSNHQDATKLPIPREQTSALNEGPTLYDMVQTSGVTLSSNDPRLRMWDAPKKGEYALQGDVNVAYLVQPGSLDSSLAPSSLAPNTADNRSSSSGSASTDIYTANDRCYSSPEIGTDRRPQAQSSTGGKSMPYHPVQSRGSGLTEFFNAEPFQLQLRHDEMASQPTSQPGSLHPAQHEYMNYAAPQNIPQGMPKSMPHIAKQGMSHNMPDAQRSMPPVHLQFQPGQPGSMTSQAPNSMTSLAPSTLTSHASTEELHNERNEELEKSLENVTLEDKPEDYLESTKVYEVGRTPSGPMNSSLMNSPGASSRLTTDSSGSSYCLPNAPTNSSSVTDKCASASSAAHAPTLTSCATGNHMPSDSDQSEIISAQSQSERDCAQRKGPTSLPEMSHMALSSPPPRSATSAPPSLIPSHPSPQEISQDKVKKAFLLPMPLETGDTGEICESDLKDIDL